LRGVYTLEPRLGKRLRRKKGRGAVYSGINGEVRMGSVN